MPHTLDPDVTRRDESAYWAAALVLAMRANDRARETLARRHLRRMGFILNRAKPARKAVVR